MPAILGYAALVTGRAPSNITADGLSTTLNGSTSIGAASAVLASGAGFTPGTVVLIDTGGSSEIALIASISTNTVTFADALTIAHASGAAFARAIVPWAPPEHQGAGLMPRSPWLTGGG